MRHLATYALILLNVSLCLAQQPVKYQKVSIDCLFLGNLRQKEFVINSDQEFYQITKLRTSIPGIKCAGLPDIDFKKKTLVGYIVSVGSCPTPTFHMSFTQSESNYLLKVEVQTLGVCRRGYSELYWLVIDKVEDPESIHFETVFL
ncbi:MAG: hypothetical protein RIC30_18105 [Marinoscillum sp.]|uniref:hypothetical protein n=1 Tax=Marinoscillum sp. TaxID=2024838 RepID=UPI0032F1C96C